MSKTIFILLICCLFPASFLSAQCVGSDSLWKKVVKLRSSSTPPTSQLQILLKDKANIERCPEQNDSSHALLLQSIGSLYFLRGDYLQAIQYGRRAIQIISTNRNKSTINESHLVMHYYSLSRYYNGFNMVTERVKALDSSIAVSMRLKVNNLYCLAALYQRTEYSFDIGDYHECLNYANQCEKLAMEYAKRGSLKEQNDGMSYASSSSAWKVNGLLELKRFAEAEKLLEDKVNKSKSPQFESSLGTLYEQLAEIEVSKENYAKAVSYFDKALLSDAKFGFGMGCKTIVNNLAYNLYFKKLNDLDKSLVTLHKALSYVNQDTTQNAIDAFETLNVLANIAQVFVKKKIFDSAFRYFQLAFDQVKPGTNESEIVKSRLDDFIKTKKISYLVSLCTEKGDAFWELYHDTKKKFALDEAIRIYEETDKLLERIRIEESEIQSKLFWRNDTRHLYEHAISVCYEGDNMPKAFYFFERSRAVLLNDELNQRSLFGSKEIARLVQVKKSILQFERDLRNATDPKQVQELQDSLFEKQRERDQLSNAVSARNPYYYSSFLDSSSLSLQRAKEEILKDHAALIEMFVGDSAVYMMTITKEEARINRVKKSAYDQLVDQYILYISNPVLINKQFNLFRKVSGELYHLIFQKDSLPAGRIIISPDGTYFPFEALIKKQEKQPYYFLYDYAVSYTYSAKFLTTKFSSATKRTVYNFMGIAPVNFPPGFNLSALSGSDRSVNSVQSYFSHADNFIGTQASKNNFTANFPRYKIIQLYTHASESSQYKEPVIFFSDSSLYLADLIPSTDYNTQLIVLSACETGIGILYKGEGVFSFNRAFASLGIPSCISNLWAVDNESTYRLTELFYKYLSKGSPIDVSLQKAKIQFIRTATSKEKQLPSYWAGTILTGKTNKVEYQKANWAWLIVVMSSLALLSLLILIQWKQKNGRMVVKESRSRSNKNSKTSIMADFPRSICVKFRENINVPYAEQDEVSDYISKREILPVKRLIELYKGIEIEKYFTSVEPARIMELLKEAEENKYEGRPMRGKEKPITSSTYRPQLLSYFKIKCPYGTDLASLQELLGKYPSVEKAYVESGPYPPSVNADNDKKSFKQNYLDAAPTGIDARFAWTVAGGDGSSTVRFLDIENGWTLNHEDLPRNIDLLYGVNHLKKGHGTSVLGIVLAKDNTKGGIGITPRVQGSVMSTFETDDASSYNKANTILRAFDKMSFGDVVLLEIQGQIGEGATLWPGEVEIAVFDAIFAARSKLVIVEAAGNGTLNGGRNVNDEINKDSGAIMVAAATSAHPHQKIVQSNFGSRVDCFAWGENITTTGDGDIGDSPTAYTDTFDGTSGASAIIAGAAVAIQSMCETKFGSRFYPASLRDILRNPAYGTQPGPGHAIGVMPDLQKIYNGEIA